MRYLQKMKRATLEEFDEEEADWRETAERQVEDLALLDNPLPAPAELDELDPDEAIRQIEISVENNTELCYAVDADTRTWSDIAIARQRARARAMKKRPAKARAKADA
jgi:hypothetical protein